MGGLKLFRMAFDCLGGEYSAKLLINCHLTKFYLAVYLYKTLNF